MTTDLHNTVGTTNDGEDSRPHAEVFRNARKAFDLIEEHQTPPLPSIYAVWFNYVTGLRPEVTEKVDALLAAPGAISAYELSEIYEEHLAASPSEIEKRRLGQDMEEEITGALALVQEGIDSSDRFSVTLDKVEGDLPGAASPERLHSLLSRLIEENQNMAQQTRDLNEGLKSSQRQIEILNRELNEIEEQSMRDPLTSVANRRAFDMRLLAEIENSEKTGAHLCLVLVDIDRFKRVNDEFGHLIGDAVLKVLASLLSQHTKGRDMVARYGGEEFAIILPQTPLVAAVNLAEKIRMELSQGELRATKTGKSIGTITASFGIASFGKGMDAHAFIDAADQQLYLAKANGRNRVEAAASMALDTATAPVEEPSDREGLAKAS